jgi:hypothetical protein
MKQKVTTKQLVAVSDFLKNLKDFTDRKYGTISNLQIMTHKLMPNSIFVKYEKDFTTAGERDYQNRIASIDVDGNITFIDDKFKDIFERSAFLSECKPFDVENPNHYEKID